MSVVFAVVHDEQKRDLRFTLSRTDASGVTLWSKAAGAFKTPAEYAADPANVPFEGFRVAGVPGVDQLTHVIIEGPNEPTPDVIYTLLVNLPPVGGAAPVMLDSVPIFEARAMRSFGTVVSR